MGGEELEGATVHSAAASGGCLFCGPYRHHFPLEPMNVPLLMRFLNTSGKILGRRSTGLCTTHQRYANRINSSTSQLVNQSTSQLIN